MAVFRFAANTQGGQETQMCSYPIGLDPYRSGCSNNCSYCYVRHRLQDMSLWKVSNPSKLDVDHLVGLFDKVLNKGIVRFNTDRLLYSRLPLRVGMNTDPFQEVEKQERITYAILKILKQYNYPYILLTKNSMVAEDDYLPLYDHNISYLQITITTLNEEISRKIEQGASLPKDRLNALKTLSEAGLRVAARINPMFPIYSDGHYSDGNAISNLNPLEVFSWELVERICECKPSTVIAGFLRVESQKTHRWIENEAGINLRSYFWKHRSQKYYSREEIDVYYNKCKAICDKHGIPFTVCFDRNENYDYFKHMWANPNDCCNGLGQSACFNKTFKSISGES